MAKSEPMGIADGEDVAQGSVNDAAWVSGSGTVISLLKKIAGGGGGGGGGPVTIADGADVAQGTTTDASTANTVVGLLKAIKAAVQGTLSVSTTAINGADATQGNVSDTAWVSGNGTVISLLKKIASAGGGAVSIADGADVAQGTTTDPANTNTVIGQLKQAVAKLTGTLTADVTDRAARLLGHVTVDNFPATQPVSGTVATTVADGANVTQGAKADAAWVSGDGTVISLLKKIASAGGSAVSVADGADVAQGTTSDAAWVSGSGTVISLLKKIAGGAASDVTDRAARLLGHVTVDNFPATQPVSGSVSITGTPTVDTELPTASALADAEGNPTVPRVGGMCMVWNGTGWDRAPGTAAAGLKVQSAQLPAALDGSGFLKTHEQGTAAISAASLPLPAGASTEATLSAMSGKLPATLGQKAMSASEAVVIASDQSAVPENLTQVGGVAIASKAGGTFGQTALPVWKRARQIDTYTAPIALGTGALTAGVRKDIFSIHHTAASVKTVRILRISISAVVVTAGAAPGYVVFYTFAGIAVPTVGTLQSSFQNNRASANAEAACNAAPTITAGTGPLYQTLQWTAAVGAFMTDVRLYDYVDDGDQTPLTLRAGVLESFVIAVLAGSTPNLTVEGYMTFTEE